MPSKYRLRVIDYIIKKLNSKISKEERKKYILIAYQKYEATLKVIENCKLTKNQRKYLLEKLTHNHHYGRKIFHLLNDNLRKKFISEALTRKDLSAELLIECQTKLSNKERKKILLRLLKNTNALYEIILFVKLNKKERNLIIRKLINEKKYNYAYLSELYKNDIGSKLGSKRLEQKLESIIIMYKLRGN